MREVGNQNRMSPVASSARRFPGVRPMRESAARLRRFLAELRRRKVFQVAIAYGAGAFAIVQVAAAAFPALHLPPAALTLVVVLAILGFPIAVILSWAYDITPDPRGWSVGSTDESSPTPGREASHRSRGEGTGVQDGSAVQQPSAPASPHEPVVVDNLPTQLTEFVGRRQELDKIGELLRSGACRLLTICGTGGIGKTRLALQVATEYRHLFPHGVCFVPLSSVDSAERLISAILERLGLTLSGTEKSNLQLLDYLRARSILLVLDNFEHLAEAAGLLSEVLEQASAIRIVVTSRERLNLHGETLFPLDGLQLPPVALGDEAERYEAVQLFVRSAQRVQPNFALDAEEMASVVRICRLVEGIPLALELASAWVRVLRCSEIADAIQRDRDFLSASFRDLPERHRSLRASFESAWRLLSDEEKTAYRRLALFRGGFTREAAHAVTGTSFTLLSALLDKSLVRRASARRFEIVEVLRQFAEERLLADPLESAQVQQLHTDHYAALLERAEQSEDADEVAADLENCRAAWRHAVRVRQLEPIAQSLHALYTFYDSRGWVREGEEMMAAAAASLNSRRETTDAQRARRDLLLAKLQVRQGVFCSDLGLSLKARELLEKALDHFRQAGEQAETAFALDQLGSLLNKTGHSHEAKRLYTESMSIYRELGDLRSIGRLATHLGNVAFAQGEYDEAQRLYRESAALLKDVGDRSGMAAPLRNLGVIASLHDAHVEALQLFRESLQIAREQNDQRGIVHSLQNLGFAAYRAGAFAEAERYLHEGVGICREMGFRRLLAFCLNALGNVAAAADREARARDLYHQALGIALEIGETPLLLEILIGTARLRQRAADYEGAAELLALIRHHPASDQDTRNTAHDVLGAVSAQLSPGSLRAAIERGRTTELSSAARRVLEESPPISVGMRES
jgi:predicted ATPase